MSGPVRTLGEWAYLNLKNKHGAVRAPFLAAKVGAFLWQMAVTADNVHHWPPTREELRAEWGRQASPRTISRELAYVREAFPDTPLPALGDWLQARRHEQQLENVKQLEALPFPARLRAA
jgi:hypothetical protein